MAIEPETQLGIVRDAASGQARVAWVGWMFGVVCFGLGLVRPQHWALAAIGAVLLVAMAGHAAWRIRVRQLRHHRASSRPLR